MTVMVTGASGNVGSAVVRALRSRGVEVRVRGERLEGCDALFLSSADWPGKVEFETATIDAAEAAGVRLIVKASTPAAQAGSPLPPFDWHGRIEAHLRASGVPWVLLHSGFYMTNVAMTVRGGAVVAPAGRGAVAMIDPADVGEVGAAALVGEARDVVYELTGPEAITYADAAAALGLPYVDAPPDAARAGMAAAGLPDWLVTHLDGVFAAIRAGELARVTDTVAEVLGRPARSFRAFAREFSPAMSAG